MLTFTMLIANANCINFLTEDFLIATIGNELHFFYDDYTDDDECDVGSVKCSSCPRDKIHDIDVKTIDIRQDDDDGSRYEHYIIARAGNEVVFTVVRNKQFQPLHLIKFNDWIIGVKFSCDPRVIFVLTAHNQLAEVKIDFKTGSNTVTRRIASIDSSTLYTARIEGEVWDALYIFSGTAMGELNVWRPTANGETRLRLTDAHNGVITSISVNFKINLMITTSDDRSVQFWTIEQTSEMIALTYEEDKIFFERKLKAEKTWKVFGHTARVFCSLIYTDADDKPFVLSAGEDSRLCLWSSEGQLLFKKDFNGGAIWGITIDTYSYAYVSLANGSLERVRLEDKFVEQDPPEQETADHENPAKVRILEDILIVLTNKGELLYKDFEVGTAFTKKFRSYRVELVREGNDFLRVDIGTNAKICCMEMGEDYFYLLTIYGVLILIDVKNGFELKLADKIKIPLNSPIARSVHFPSKKTILVTGNNGDAVLLSNKCELIRRYTIPKCSEPWATAAFR